MFPVMFQHREQGAEFSPDQVSGLTVWLAARLETGFSDNDLVQTITDQSGNSNHASQAVEGNRATYQSDAGNTINGQPVFLFDNGRPDFYDLTGFTGTQTLFIVAKAPAANSSDTIMSGAGANQFRNILTYAAGGDDMCDLRDAENIVAAGTIAMGTGVRLISMTVDATGESSMWIDSTSSFSAVNLATVGPYTRMGVSNDEVEQPFSGSVAEVLLYNSALSAGDRGSVETYLKALYGIS
jgi:hypothetical protein